MTSLLLWWTTTALSAPPTPPKDQWVKLSDVAPTVVQDIRYYRPDNFFGKRVPGYEAPQCWLSKAAAEALAAAQEDIRPQGLTLKVFDCYRPQRAVDNFMAWAKTPADEAVRLTYHPRVAKELLLEQGYIASPSSHSRGSTVDITLARVNGPDLDMGTRFDFFDPQAHSLNTSISKEAQTNRRTLRELLQRFGFKNYKKEWWHFTLAKEPFPSTYFDIPVGP